MATLSNPTFQVDALTGMPNHYLVSGTVTVGLTPFEVSLIQMGFPLQLQTDIWADDTSPLALTEGPSKSDYIRNYDDLLFLYPTQNISAPGTYTVNAIVRREYLDEDNYWAGERDEAYNKFSLVTGNPSNLFPSNRIEINSPPVMGVVEYSKPI
jgi:hypothetical protein